MTSLLYFGNVKATRIAFPSEKGQELRAVLYYAAVSPTDSSRHPVLGESELLQVSGWEVLLWKEY